MKTTPNTQSSKEDSRRPTLNLLQTSLTFQRLHTAFLNTLQNRLKDVKHFELEASQALVLYQIGNRKLSVNDIALYGYYDQTNITHTLKKFIALNYITKTTYSEDRRKTLVCLTKKALTLCAALDTIIQDLTTEIKLSLSPSDEENLSLCLQTLKNFWSILL